MAKRRFRPGEEESKPPERLSPEERRTRRRAERARSGKSSKPRIDRTGWRRGIVPGVVVTAAVVIIVFLVLESGHLFQPPCLALQSIPEDSGIPAFPPGNTTDFSQTWCPNDALVLQVSPYLQININGHTASLPPSIGRNTNFTAYECDLPIRTNVPASGVPNGVIDIASPWPYQYTLGDFFSVWQDSYKSAYINATYSTTTIDYTPTDLLGLPIDATHTLTMFVDNQPSTQGPNLDLDQYDYSGGPYPSCMSSVYGSGHTILLQYKAGGIGAVTPMGLQAPALQTSPGGAGSLPGLYDSAMPRVVLDSAHVAALDHLRAGNLAWLAIRVH